MRDETKLLKLKRKFIEQAAEMLVADADLSTYRKTFTNIVKEAVDCGATTDEIKSWGKEAGLTPQAVNRALRLAGIRQRSERSDKGKSKDGDSGSGGVAEVAGDTPNPDDWAHGLLLLLKNDKDAALAFVDQMIDYITK